MFTFTFTIAVIHRAALLGSPLCKFLWKYEDGVYTIAQLSEKLRKVNILKEIEITKMGYVG